MSALFADWTVVEHPRSLQCKPNPNSWFKVNRLETAGLSVGDDDRVIFASPECLRLWTALDTMDRGVVVEGSPGLGKSVSVWAWTCYQAMSLEKKVLWIHVDKLMYQMCVYLSPDQCKVMESTGRSNLEDLMETTDADILVFDGYKSSIPLEDCINAVFPFESKSQRKGIVVSSKVGGLELDDFPPKLGNRITFFHFGPWLLDTYFAACANEDFFRSVSAFFDIPALDDDETSTADPDYRNSRRRAQIEEKFYYSGASARWMFTKTIEFIKGKVARLLDKVKNFKTLVDEMQRYASTESSNHLLMRVKVSKGFQTFFVSRYVLKKVLHKSRDISDIQRAYELARRQNNPVFLGWVVEFDFLEKLVESSRGSSRIMNLYNNVEGQVFWKVSCATKFNPDLPFKVTWLPNQYRIPQSWCEGGYDAVGLIHIGGKRVLRFIQVTRGKSHKLKLRFFSELAAKFSKAQILIDGIEIAVVLPRFEDHMQVFETKISIENSGQLSNYNVGSSTNKWLHRKEETQVVFMYFDADEGVRKGRAFDL